jgi:small neutral amino acid transporter SnatA (MarC family)
MAALQRLMGMLLMMISIQMIVDGIEDFACDCMVHEAEVE